MALAQDTGSWIDPPAQVTPSVSAPAEVTAPSEEEVVPAPRVIPAQPRAALPPRVESRRAEADKPTASPIGKPRQAAKPPRKAAPVPPQVAKRKVLSSDTSRIAAAESLARAYMKTWSVPNGLTLPSTMQLYAPHVRFHGRMMGARALLEEKRRFVQRWPERNYRPRFNTMATACTPQGTTCTVRAVFDFAAANPVADRRSQGIGTLELVVSFSEKRPVIAAENSIVTARGRAAQRVALKDTDHE